MFTKFFTIGITSVILILSVIALYLWQDNLKLENKISELESSLIVCQTNKYTLEQAINSQNDKISKYEIDLENKNKSYQELLNKPAEIRFETIYKKIPSIKVDSDECKDIKNLLDDIRSNGY